MRSSIKFIAVITVSLGVTCASSVAQPPPPHHGPPPRPNFTPQGQRRDTNQPAAGNLNLRPDVNASPRLGARDGSTQGRPQRMRPQHDGPGRGGFQADGQPPDGPPPFGHPPPPPPGAPPPPGFGPPPDMPEEMRSRIEDFEKARDAFLKDKKKRSSSSTKRPPPNQSAAPPGANR